MPAGISSRAHDNKIIVHDKLPPQAIAFIHEFLLISRRMHQQHISLALGAHGNGLAGPDSYGLHKIAALFLKHGQQRVQKPRVLRAGRGGKNNIFAACRRLDRPQSHRLS